MPVDAEHNCALPSCSLPDDDDMVSCDSCRRWWHYACGDFNPSLFDTATSWFCHSEECKRVGQGDQIREVEERHITTARDSDADVLASVDVLIEAAKVAQSVVEKRNSEIASLRVEMDRLKSQLAAASSVPVKKVTGEVESADSKDPSSARLEAIRQIDRTHRQLLAGSHHATTSIPLPAKRDNKESFQDDLCHQPDMANLLTILNRNQVQELPSFSGHDKREWPYFEAVFRSTTTEGRYNGKENVARLRKALKGEACNFVSDRLRYSTDADGIMDSLRAIYGRPDILVHSLTSDLLKLPALGSSSDVKLRQWAVTLNGFVADIKSMDLEKELDNSYVLTDLASKLSPSLYHDWQKRKSSKPFGNLGDFALFLTDKLLEMPPEMSKPSKSSICERVTIVPGSSRRVLTHQPSCSSGICIKCGDSHRLSDCREFKMLTAEQRFAYAKDKTICFRCLDPAPHQWRGCSQEKACGVGGCSKRHHPLLHPSVPKQTLSSSARPYVPQTQFQSSHVGAKLPVLFKIVPIRLYGNNDKFVDTFAFLDDGSSITMLEKETFDELELTGDPEQLTLQWTKGVSRVEDSVRTNLCVSAVNKRKRHMLKEIYTVKGLELPSQDIDATVLKAMYPHLSNLPLPDLRNAKPKILLGLDQAKFLVGRGNRSGKDEEPHALKTVLGWTVFGRSGCVSNVSCVNPPKRSSQIFFHDSIKQDEELHDLVKRHFTTEEFGVRPPRGNFVCQADVRALEIMERTLRKVDDQYEIGLLWDSDEVQLPDSYPMAERRLISLEKSLSRNPELLEWKNQHMRELVAKGYARIASDEELNRKWARVWYAPTFIVLNKNKNPPKPRDVADVAARVNGVSLNSHLLKGPDNLVPLHAGLFKFRERRVAVNADVREMFHRIRISETDQQCQRILWRDGDTSRKPLVYIMEVMMFGPRCSPTSAQFVKNYHAGKFQEECPEAVDGLVNRTYVDDYFNSHNTVEEAVSVSRDAIRICKTMSFDLVDFQSNSRPFLEQMPEANIKSGLVSIDPNESEGYVTKILGMFWHPSSEHLLYKLSSDEYLNKMSDPETDISKREILRTIMRVFDPLGLISCVIIRGRVILQEIWREGYDWDEPISGPLRCQWLDFLKYLREIEAIRIPRAYVSWIPECSRISLITFVDASEKAFAAVSYWRFEQNGNVEIAIAMAKAKVAPVKKLSVPRLELQAAVLGVRVAETVIKSHTIQPAERIFLSDSKTVLSWIGSSTFKFPSFVAVRVGEILETTDPSQWWFVGSTDNVADDGTRWSESSYSFQSQRWFTGPDFLIQSRASWPISPGKAVHQVSDVDLNPTFSINVHQREISYGVFDELSPRFRSRWYSAVRVLALILRFKNILQGNATEKEVFATPFEIVQAENWMFRKIQQDAFHAEILSLKAQRCLKSTSHLLSLSPFLDEEGTMRLSSRAQKANLSYAARNPAILPKTHPLVDLLVQHHHEANLHAGTATTISDIREKAWIISIRGAVARVKARCFMCRRLKANPVMPLMGQLPEARLAFDLRPFTHVGVDCFGPMCVKYGRGSAKRYGMIFTCLTFRAVHIEMLNDLSLDQCTMAVRRFLINRVVTRFIYSDNGLNFVGTKNRLEKDVKEMEAALGEYCAKYEGILWRFIPAYSPWMGGAWERLIKSIKVSLDFILKGVTPREDVLLNALVEAQGQINRRPLTHIPVDPEDPKPLTPNSILFGDAERDVTAPGVFSARDQWSRLYSRRAQHLMKEFSRHWYTEYLPEITRRSKWYKDTKPVKVGSIVLVVEPTEGRSAWKLGRVTTVYPGPDGVVRTADVRLANNVLMVKRAVGRLAVLDLESST